MVEQITHHETQELFQSHLNELEEQIAEARCEHSNGKKLKTLCPIPQSHTSPLNNLKSTVAGLGQISENENNEFINLLPRGLEDGYTVSIVIDNHKLCMNPRSVLP